MYLTDDVGPREVTYLIDRKNDYYWVEGLHFPLPEDERDFHTGTLVDGELVNDVEPNGSIQMRYLVFDCLMLDGNSLMHRTLDKRLAYFKEKVYKPYRALYQKYPEDIQYLPFHVKFKEMEFSYAIEKMFRSILPSLPHGNDGLIFTCRNSQYKFGTDEHILKWKRENENSVDFMLTLSWPKIEPDSEDEADGITSPYEDYDATPRFDLAVNHGANDYRLYSTMYLEPTEWEKLKALGEPLDNRIVECYQDRQSRWRFLRFRDDKKEANHISTVDSVMESIQDKVSDTDLIRTARRIRDEWKKRDAATDAAAKQEADAKRRGAALANGQTGGVRSRNGEGGSRNGEGVTKRKIEEVEPAADGPDSAKRQMTE